eukprot:CAMPEP_0171909218 /NCGR_PEP_ID=MMETSP0993-20121228/8607_1 /TAXON_ID=483369 /ORGANISM="non described non described, Strain CCMP2098" /LENGTH=71 /DNA_ID=CAMNT_0012542153 /DNA_START=62 /DNA_END=274 /DNA_ORIENTATION=-
MALESMDMRLDAEVMYSEDDRAARSSSADALYDNGAPDTDFFFCGILRSGTSTTPFLVPPGGRVGLAEGGL